MRAIGGGPRGAGPGGGAVEMRCQRADNLVQRPGLRGRVIRRRLDHAWVTPAVEGALRSVETLRPARGWDRPSDHVPVTLTLSV